MNIRWNGTPERIEEIQRVLPKQPITDTILVPGLMKVAKKLLIKCLLMEIEIYKAFPKAGKMDKITFNPTHHSTCFMGQGFMVGESGSDTDDADLRDYREAVGTLNHKRWGKATLLEVWAADHFDSNRSMVKGVFSYCKGDRATLPQIKFEVFPLFENKKSGKKTFNDHDKWYAMDLYLKELNHFFVQYGQKKKVREELSEADLADFEKHWERTKTALDI